MTPFHTHRWLVYVSILVLPWRPISGTSPYPTVEIKSHKVTRTARDMLGPLDMNHRVSEMVSSDTREKRALFSLEREQDLIDRHNALRRRITSSDMEFMTRHSELTRMAEDWARLCIWEHGQPFRENPPFDHIGQNLYAYNGTFDPLRGLQLWFDEYVYYDYDTGACSKEPCGHYTQMAWSTSRMVGCAYAYCPSLRKQDLINGNYLVCNYGPAGNWVEEKPYKIGPECTQCESGQFWCDAGLCKSSCTRQSTKCECKASCQNCGTERTSNCSCSCARGWTGPNCAEPCQNNHKYCGANPGWPKDFCYKPSVKKYCLALCDLCEVQTGPAVTCTTTPSTTPPSKAPLPSTPPTDMIPREFEFVPDESAASRCTSSLVTSMVILVSVYLLVNHR